MKKLVFAVLTILFATLLISCEDDLKNGRVPAQYLPTAQSFVGQYTGRLGQTPNVITLSLNGDLAQMTTAADLVGPQCGSRVGQLARISITNNAYNPILAKAEFYFYPGNCGHKIIGDRLIVTVYKSAQIKLQLATGTTTNKWCTNNEDAGGCSYTDIPVYIEGLFVRP